MVYPGTYNENILFINKDITLSSSDPSDPVIVATTIIHGTGSDSVVQFFFLDVSSLEGFTINGGFAGEGGGIDIYNSSPTIKNNTITNNTAANQGGGIFIRDSSSPTIVNNTITDNTTVMSESSGGGIYMDNSSPTIIGNAINGCSAMYGGGISMYSSSPTIKNNIIHYNFATIFGGGVYMQDSSPTITDNTITDNTASSGGGILVHGGSPTIGGSDPSDTDNFNTICGNDPDQVNSSYTYFNNYISSTCFD